MSSSKPKLYYTPTSCGAASYIAAHAAGIDFDREQVNIRTHKTASGGDYYAINPKGNVPALVVGGVTLNEGAATLQYIADQAPQSKLAPAFGTIERYQLIQALNYIASEVHASFGPLFNPAITPEAKAEQLKKLNTKLDYLEAQYVNGGKKFLVGDNFTVADAYLYVVLSWSPYVGATLDQHPNVKKYFEGIGALQQVKDAQAAMAKETPAP